MAVRADLIAKLAKNADNAGRVAKKAVNVDVTGKLAKNAASKGEVSASMIQQLAMSDNADDLAMLQAIVKDMPPERLDAILVKAFRDPRSPKDAPTLTPQGQMIADVARGGEPDPVLTKTAAQGGGDTGIHEVDVGNVSDLPPKSAPYKPKTNGAGKELSDDPKFHVKERIVTKDGKTQVKTPAFDEKGKLQSPKGSGSASIDAQTAAAVKTAAKGGNPKPIGDNAALKNSRSQEQNYSSAIARLAGLVDPRGVKDMPSPGFGPGMADKAVSGGVPGSAIKGAKPKKPRTAPMIAAESVIDYDEIARLANEAGLDIGMASTDPEEFARLLVSKADQGMFDATPLTASQRAEMTGVAKYLSADPAQSGPVLRGAYPEAAAGGSMAGRQGSVQQQAIEAITRKIRDNFNTESMPIHEGNVDAALPPYKPNAEGVESQFAKYQGKAGERPKEARPVQGPVESGDEGIPLTPAPIPPVGNVRDAGPAGDLTGTTQKISAMRAADRAPVVENVSSQYGRQFTSRRVADIEAEMAGLSRNDPQYRELGLELRDAKLIDSFLEPHKRMAATKEGPVPPAPFKQGEVPDTPEDAAFQFLYDNNIGTHEQRMKLLQQGNIVDTVAKIRNKIHADAVAAQGTTPTINGSSSGVSQSAAPTSPAAQTQSAAMKAASALGQVPVTTESAAMKSAAALGQVPTSSDHLLNVGKQATEGAKVRTLMESLSKGLENTKATKDFLQKHGGASVGKAIEYGIPTALIGGGLGAIYSGAQYLFGDDDGGNNPVPSNNRPKRRPFGR